MRAVEPNATPVRIALLGYGTIGGALHRLLVEHAHHIQRTTGRDIVVTCALVRDASRARAGIAGSSMQLVDNADELFATAPDIVCEALGGVDPARSLVLRALSGGIHVVTANKQLIARHGAELFAAAEAASTQLRFEASVCGAIPVIRLMRESLAAARIESVQGILNGTTNYVLSAMASEGSSYEDALARAQALGYAEPDPTDDVMGIDAAAKLAILAGIAFQGRASIDQVATTGITHVSAADIQAARRLGCAVRLVGRARRHEDGAMLDVSPALVPQGHPLAAVSGATNAVLLTGATFRELALQGPGAGGPETASALAGDIVGILGSTASFLTHDPAIGGLQATSPDLLPERHYVRMLVPDRPGVLAGIAGALADHDTSIEQVVQSREDGDRATLVLVTHPSTRRDLRRALAAAGFGHPEDSPHHATVMPILESPT